MGDCNFCPNCGYDLDQYNNRFNPKDIDELYNSSIQVISKLEKVSASTLQKELSIGYASAARLLEKLEEKGIIEKSTSSRPRKIIKKAIRIAS
jgi:DNA segregation ATPase FtsK/SpoIIIE, S-DNA-T family